MLGRCCDSEKICGGVRQTLPLYIHCTLTWTLPHHDVANTHRTSHVHFLHTDQHACADTLKPLSQNTFLYSSVSYTVFNTGTSTSMSTHGNMNSTHFRSSAVVSHWWASPSRSAACCYIRGCKPPSTAAILSCLVLATGG